MGCAHISRRKQTEPRREATQGAKLLLYNTAVTHHNDVASQRPPLPAKLHHKKGSHCGRPPPRGIRLNTANSRTTSSDSVAIILTPERSTQSICNEPLLSCATPQTHLIPAELALCEIGSWTLSAEDAGLPYDDPYSLSDEPLYAKPHVPGHDNIIQECLHSLCPYHKQLIKEYMQALTGRNKNELSPVERFLTSNIRDLPSIVADPDTEQLSISRACDCKV